MNILFAHLTIVTLGKYYPHVIQLFIRHIFICKLEVKNVAHKINFIIKGNYITIRSGLLLDGSLNYLNILKEKFLPRIMLLI